MTNDTSSDNERAVPAALGGIDRSADSRDKSRGYGSYRACGTALRHPCGALPSIERHTVTYRAADGRPHASVPVRHDATQVDDE